MFHPLTGVQVIFGFGICCYFEVIDEAYISMVQPRKERLKLHGNFQLPEEREAFGELIINGKNTSLTLSGRFELSLERPTPVLFGVTIDRTKITCMDCIESSQTRKHGSPTEKYCESKIFPHYVVIGNEHLNPFDNLIERIDFSVSDMSSIFYDFDAFGLTTAPPGAMDIVLEQRRQYRPIEVGEFPEIAYFTGKMTVIEVATPIGNIAVRHRPTFGMGGPSGVSFKNKIYISIEPTSPINFNKATDHIALIRRFLTIIAGRSQALEGVELKTITTGQTGTSLLKLHWSYAPKGPQGDQDKPSPADLPLNALDRPEEFARVLSTWIERDGERKTARIRYVSCLERGNMYGVDRLIAAANMFDLLPGEALQHLEPLPADLAEVRSECVAKLKMLSPSLDRDRAIADLSRIGRPSLPKKVMYRFSLIKPHIDPYLPGLDFVLKLAVSFRDYFVHGSPDAKSFAALERFVPFFTDALEFVFAASDLVDMGWDAHRWATSSYSWGHAFTRFRCGYKSTLDHLKQSMVASA